MNQNFQFLQTQTNMVASVPLQIKDLCVNFQKCFKENVKDQEDKWYRQLGNAVINYIVLEKFPKCKKNKTKQIPHKNKGNN